MCVQIVSCNIMQTNQGLDLKMDFFNKLRVTNSYARMNFQATSEGSDQTARMHRLV